MGSLNRFNKSLHVTRIFPRRQVVFELLPRTSSFTGSFS